MSDDPRDLAVALSPGDRFLHVGPRRTITTHLTRVNGLDLFDGNGTPLWLVDAPQGSPRLLATHRTADPDEVLRRIRTSTIVLATIAQGLEIFAIPSTDGSLEEVVARLAEAFALDAAEGVAPAARSRLPSAPPWLDPIEDHITNRTSLLHNLSHFVPW